MKFRQLMLYLVASITALQLPAIAFIDNQVWWAAATRVAALAALWLGYFYRYAPPFRIVLTKLFARYSQNLTTMQIDARFRVTGDLGFDEVIGIVHSQYPQRGSRSEVRIFASGGQRIMRVPPGWEVHIAFSTAADAELIADDLDERERHIRDMTLTVPNTQTSIGGVLSLLDLDIIPLLEAFLADLPLKLEAVELSLRFLRSVNPYLAAYLQNIDLEDIESLKCVLKENRDGAQTNITREKITFNGRSLSDLRNLVHQHTALQLFARSRA